MKLPNDFLIRLEQILPTEKLQNVLASYQNPKPVGCRINTLKISVADAIDKLKESDFTPTFLSWSDTAFTLPHEQRDTLIRHPLFQSGEIYIQSLSSQLPPIILAPKPHEEILDLTAAPGSKTTQIAALMQNTGRLAAVEKSKDRFFKLRANCQNLGVTNTAFYLKDGITVGRACPERFDRVLLDAPCSAEGRFDLCDEKSITQWSLQKVKGLAQKQRALILSAWQALKTNGALLYATCTLAPEENELIIEKLIKKHQDSVEILSIPLFEEHADIAIQPGITTWKNKTLSPHLSKAIRVLPSKITDGFFICLLRKRAGV